MASLLLKFKATNTYTYALTKNLTHESAVAGVQGSPGQHPIVSAAVPDGDKGYRYLV